MTNSKSSSWISRALMVLVALLLTAGIANANRRRLVVLEFDGGDDAMKIQKSLVKFLKKEHTVISASKWNKAAEELGATKLSEKNIKKVAKKLKIDGVITGNVDKRRDMYIIRIKLRAGSTGAVVGSQIATRSDAPKLSKSAKTDLKDELFGQIDGLETVRSSGGGDDDEDEEEDEEKERRPSKFGGKQMRGGDDEEEEDEEDEKPRKLSKKEEEKRRKDEERKEREAKKAKEEEERRAKAEEKRRKDDEEKERLAKKRDRDNDEGEEEEEEEEEEGDDGESKKERKRTAKRDDGDEEDEEGIEEEAEPAGKMSRKLALSPANRAVDAVVGVSMNMRRMSFSYNQNIGTRPAGYKGKLVPGGFIDMTFYPLALGHRRRDILKNIGATFMYDQVLLVKSKDASGNELKSAQVRYAFGAVFRYPFGESASAPVIGARLRYGSQSFKISQPSPLPSVTYDMIEPGAFFRLPLMDNKLVLDANVAFLGILNAGQIQNMDKYGGATLTGFEMSAGADYHLAQALFLRGMFNFETIGYSFKKNGMLPTPADNQKVSGARDSYYGIVVSAGYLF